MVKTLIKKDKDVSSFATILESYRKKRDEAELQAIERRSKYFSIHKDLEQVENELNAAWIEKAHKQIRGINDKNSDIDNKIAALLVKKEEMLKKYNINDFDPKYECDKCKDTGFLSTNTKCPCLIKREEEYVRENNLDLNKDFSSNFDSLDISYYKQNNVKTINDQPYFEYMTKNIQAIKNTIINIKNNPTNIYIMGEEGTGKSFLAGCIKNLAYDNNYSVICITGTDLMNEIYEDDKIDTLQKLYNVDVLIIDDLGSDYNSEFTNSYLLSIIDKRINYKKSTIITSNLSFEQIKEYYQNRIASRINYNYALFRLYGRDLREKI